MADPALRPITVNGVTVDFDAGLLRDPVGTEIPLRAQSFAVLRHLAANAGRVVAKDELIAAVWHGIAVTDDSLVQCIGDIRRALRDESQTVLKTVPRRGYRLTPPTAAAAVATAPAPARRAVALGLALVVLLLIAAGVFWQRADSVSSAGPPSVAVLPFDDMSAEGGLRYLGDGVAEDIISMLASAPDVAVIARNSSFTYREKPVDIRQIGRDLGVDYVLEGSVRKEGDALRIVAQLNDPQSGRHLWAERFDKAGTDPWALQDEVTGRIIGALTGETGQLKHAQYREAWGKDTTNLAEYDYYLRGHDILLNVNNKEGNDRADRIFRNGLERFPNSTLLKIKLAFSTHRRAYYYWSDNPAIDFAQAGNLVREVLASDNLTPQVARLAHWLNAYILMRAGDFSGAVAEANKTTAMAPYDAYVITDLAEVLGFAGEYDQALRNIAMGEAQNPADADYQHGLRGWIYRLKGQYETSIREFAAASALLPYQRLHYAISLSRVGRIEEARAEVRAALGDAPETTLTAWRSGPSYSDPTILDGELADLAAAGLPR